MHNTDWCEVSLQLTEIATKNIGDDCLNPRIKYSMVSLENWYISLSQEGWQDTGQYVEQEFYITRLDWFEG